jgi:hypothetical protein
MLFILSCHCQKKDVLRLRELIEIIFYNKMLSLGNVYFVGGTPFLEKKKAINQLP